MKTKDFKKKSLLIISQYFYPEEFGINNLAEKFSKKGYEVKILTQSPSYPYDKIYDGYKNDLFQKSNYKNIKVYTVKNILGNNRGFFRKAFSYIVFSILSSIFLFKCIGNTKHVFVYQVGPLTQIIPALFSKLIYNTKIFLWVLDLWPQTVYSYGLKKTKFNKFFLDIFCKISYSFCDKIFVSNEGFIQRISEYGFNKKEILFCPQWIPNEINFSNNNSKKFKSKKMNFTFAGNIGKVQNLEIIIKSFSKFSDLVNLNILGDGSNLKNLKNLVKKNKYKNIIFHGRKPLNKISEWLISSDILIISLIDKDAFNLTVPAKFQAILGAKKPIFSIMNGETSRLVAKYNLGICANPNSIEDIKKNIKKFISLDDKQLISFSKKSDFLINKIYNFDEIMMRFEKNIFKI